MKVTSETITKIKIGLKNKSLTQSALAVAVGMHRSNMSKLLKGEINTLKDEFVDPINELLEIDIAPLITHQGSISSTALALSELSIHDPKMATLLEMLMEVSSPHIAESLPDETVLKIPISKELKDMIQKAAAIDKRSMANWAAFQLEKIVNAILNTPEPLESLPPLAVLPAAEKPPAEKQA